jgi:hypothetical protein
MIEYRRSKGYVNRVILGKEKVQRTGKTVSRSTRIKYVATAWALSIVAIVFITRGTLAYIWPFPSLSPAGAPVLFSLIFLDPDSHNGTQLAFAAVVGWLYYLGLTILALRAQSERLFFWAYISLLVSLMLTLGGCEAMKHADWSTKASTGFELANSR